MKRKTLIYKTGVEYGDYTLNHIFGCSHGCRYPCYAYMMAKRFGKVKDYQEWINPTIIENAMELLDEELPRLKEKIRMLHLCFSTDPFMLGNKEINNLSVQILQKANEAGVCCSVLTKGLLPLSLANLPLDNEYGITLVTLNQDFIDQYEPGAANIRERVLALRRLHDRNCRTWVSIEPYPTPNMIKQDLAEILEEISFVDKIIFGRLHYNSIVSDYKDYKTFYNQCALEVIDFCRQHQIDYHIKKGTQTSEN